MLALGCVNDLRTPRCRWAPEEAETFGGNRIRDDELGIRCVSHAHVAITLVVRVAVALPC